MGQADLSRMLYEQAWTKKQNKENWEGKMAPAPGADMFLMQAL